MTPEEPRVSTGDPQDPEPILARCRLVGPDEAAPFEGLRKCWWRREGIYISDVCLAVWVSPIREHVKPSEEREAQDALYTYLRQVSQTAMEHDFMRPLTCVLAPGTIVPDGPTATMLKSWTANQDWHRGAFTLYVDLPESYQAETADSSCPCEPEPEWSHRRRLADLLDPEAKTLRLPELNPMTVDQVLGEFQRAIDEQPPDDAKLAVQVRALGAAIGPSVELLAKTKKERNNRTTPIADWAKRIAGEADELAVGGKR